MNDGSRKFDWSNKKALNKLVASVMSSQFEIPAAILAAWNVVMMNGGGVDDEDTAKNMARVVTAAIRGASVDLSEIFPGVDASDIDNPSVRDLDNTITAHIILMLESELRDRRTLSKDLLDLLNKPRGE